MEIRCTEHRGGGGGGGWRSAEHGGGGGGVVGGGDLRKTELVEVVEGRGRVIVTWKQSGLCHMVWFARLIRKP